LKQQGVNKLNKASIKN